jgi:hypothetical protein
MASIVLILVPGNNSQSGNIEENHLKILDVCDTLVLVTHLITHLGGPFLIVYATNYKRGNLLWNLRPLYLL